MSDWDHAVALMERNPHPTPASLPQFVAGLNALMQLMSREGDLARRRHKAGVIDQYTRRAEAVYGGGSGVTTPQVTTGAANQPKVANNGAWRALKTKAV